MPAIPQGATVDVSARDCVLSSRAGQSLIESCLVLAVVCLIFFGVFQISQLFAAQEILHYAAGRGARAKVVGFNQFMVFKTIRVGAIPNAGRLVNPAHSAGPASQYALERGRIPLYLGAEDWGRLDPILDYEAWEAGASNTLDVVESLALADGTFHMVVEQSTPFRFPFHRAFYRNDTVKLRGESYLDNHYPLYLDDQNW